MNSALQIFDYNNNQIRVIEQNGEIWFVGKDVAEILGYKNTKKALKDHVDIEDKRGVRIVTPSRGKQDVTGINEAGVYSLIFSSKLESAKKFKRWVTHEVLPDIRKHGMYMTDKVQNMATDNPDAFEVLMQQYLLAKNKVKALEEQIDSDRAATLLGKFVVALEGSISVAEFSNFCTQHGIPNMGRNKTYEFLRNNRLVSKQKNHKNKPTLKGIQTGIVNLELSGDKMVFTTRTMITPEGAKYLFAMLFGDEYPLLAEIANAQKQSEAV